MVRTFIAISFLWIHPFWAQERLSELDLKNVRYQELPAYVKDVIVQPINGRLWFYGGEGVEYHDAAKKIIQAAFTKDQPYLDGGIVPILFEPNGKIWFSFDNGRRLISYDGKTWFDKNFGYNKAVGGLKDNRFHNGIPFFRGKDRVIWFADGRLHEKALLKERNDVLASFAIFPYLDNNGIIINFTSSLQFGKISFRSGKWETPKLPNFAMRRCLAYPTTAGYLCLTSRGYRELGGVPYLFPYMDKLPNIPKLVKDLGGELALRRHAKKALLALDPLFTDDLVIAGAKQEKNREVQDRLAPICDELRKARKKTVTFRGVKLGLVSQLTPGMDGSLLFTSSEMTGEDTVERTLVYLSSNSAKARTVCKRITNTFRDGYSIRKYRVYGKPATGYWVDKKDHAEFFDLERGETTKRTEHGMTDFLAESHDGRLFFKTSPITCYSPNSPDKRYFVEPGQSMRMKGVDFKGSFVDGEDVFIMQSGGKVTRFDGNEFESPAELQGYRHVGTALFRLGEDPKKLEDGWKGFFCLDDNGSILKEEVSVLDFLSRNGKLLSSRYRNRIGQIAFDNDGRIWVNDRYRSSLCVYAKKWEWHKEAKGKTFFPSPIANKVLLSNGLDDSCLLSIEGDHLKVEKLTCSPYRPSPRFLGPKGKSLWYFGAQSSGFGHKLRACVLDTRGKVHTMEATTPLAIDSKGMVATWTHGNAVKLFKDKELIKEFNVPLVFKNLLDSHIPLGCISSSTLYIWNGRGIMAMSMSDPNALKTYWLKQPIGVAKHLYPLGDKLIIVESEDDTQWHLTAIPTKALK